MVEVFASARRGHHADQPRRRRGSRLDRSPASISRAGSAPSSDAAALCRRRRSAEARLTSRDRDALDRADDAAADGLSGSAALRRSTASSAATNGSLSGSAIDPATHSVAARPRTSSTRSALASICFNGPAKNATTLSVTLRRSDLRRLGASATRRPRRSGAAGPLHRRAPRSAGRDLAVLAPFAAALDRRRPAVAA